MKNETYERESSVAINCLCIFFNGYDISRCDTSRGDRSGMVQSPLHNETASDMS